METVLDRIVSAKREEISRLHARASLAELKRRASSAPAPRDFVAALRRGRGLGFICEIKKASPSAGLLRADFDPAALARAYQAAGADCLSVLTDGPFFQGDLAHLAAVRAAVDLPLLRKDFVLDAHQVWEARAVGADAVLLIAEILNDAALASLLAEIRSAGMEALVELYDPENLDRVVRAGATLIGVNNRDLRTFVTSLDQTLTLAPRVPPDRLLVSESGIRTGDDLATLRRAGVGAVLIGETFMRSPDVGAKLAELRGALA